MGHFLFLPLTTVVKWVPFLIRISLGQLALVFFGEQELPWEGLPVGPCEGEARRCSHGSGTDRQ
jgi:hypothetical protein